MAVVRPAVPVNKVRIDFIGLCVLDRRDHVVRLLDTRGEPTRHWPTLFIPNHPELDGTPDVVVLPPSADRSGAVWILDDCAIRVIDPPPTAVVIDDTPIVDPLKPTPTEARSTRMLMDLNVLYGQAPRAQAPAIAATVALQTGRVSAIPGDMSRAYQFTDSVSGIEVFAQPRPLAASFEWEIDVQKTTGTIRLELVKAGWKKEVTVGGGTAVVIANACACHGETDYLMHTRMLEGLTSFKRLSVTVGTFEEEYPYDVRCGGSRLL